MAILDAHGDVGPGAALIDLVSASRRSGRSAASLAILAARGEVAAIRGVDGTLWFDRDGLDEQFGVHTVRIELDRPFW